MNSKLQYLPLVLLLILVTSCEMEDVMDSIIHGKVEVPVEMTRQGPLFVMVTRSDDIDALTENPFENVVAVLSASTHDEFTFHPGEYGLNRDDTVALIALVDNNYNGGVPYPDAGDVVGVYIPSGSLSALHPVKTLAESFITFSADRQVYNYDAHVDVTLPAEPEGAMTTILYHGQLDSLDPARLDPSGIMGYHRMVKGPGESTVRVEVMPYGSDVPIDPVYLLALHDGNGNGEMDAGDTVYSPLNEAGLPKALVVHEGANEAGTAEALYEMEEPSGDPLILRGSIAMPDGYDWNSPIFIIAAETDDPADLLERPGEVIRQFTRLENGSYEMDLAASGLEAGDKIMVAALWDRDYDGGMPTPTAGDGVGFYHKSSLDGYTFTVTLQPDETVIRHGYSPQNSADAHWVFPVDRTMYDIESEITFAIDDEPDDAETGRKIFIVAVHENGTEKTFGQVSGISDPEYAVAYASLEYVQDTSHSYTAPLLPAVYNEITGGGELPSELSVAVFAIYDSDDSGSITSGDQVAAYYNFLGVPKLYDLDWTIPSHELAPVKFLDETVPE